MHLFVVLTNVGLRANLHLGSVGVLVQHVDIVVRGDAVDALGLISGHATSTHLDLLLLGDSLQLRYMYVQE